MVTCGRVWGYVNLLEGGKDVSSGKAGGPRVVGRRRDVAANGSRLCRASNGVLGAVSAAVLPQGAAATFAFGRRGAAEWFEIPILSDFCMLQMGISSHDLRTIPKLAFTFDPSAIQVYRALMPGEGFTMCVGQNGTFWDPGKRYYQLPRSFGTEVRSCVVVFPLNFRAERESCHKMPQNATKCHTKKRYYDVRAPGRRPSDSQGRIFNPASTPGTARLAHSHPAGIRVKVAQ